MSEGLAGGDFCATRLPIRITVLLSRCKGKDFFRNCKTVTVPRPFGPRELSDIPQVDGFDAEGTG